MAEVEIFEDDDGATYDFVEVLQNSLWVSSPEYAGWLLKRSSNWFVNKSLLLRGHAWARKWVSLHGTELVYMDKEPTVDNMRRIKIRRAQITASTAITNDETEPTQFFINFNIEHTPEWQFRADSVEEKNNWIVKLSQVHAITLWLDEYDRVKVLGIGGQGTVYELVHRKTGKHLAMKEMEIKSEKQMQLAISEAVFLKKIVETVSHPNIMRIEKVFQVGSRFYLAFPLCTGGELFDAIVDRGHFSEHDAAVIIHDLISALHALHAHDILHLDIKPENILFASKDINSRILLTDFGLSKVFSEEESKFHASIEDHEIFQKNFQKHLELYIENGDLNENVSIRGTNGYISPEIIIDGYYSKAADVFASGVVLYILLCGYAPFAGRSTRQTFLKTVKGKYNMTGIEWETVSEEAKDLVKKMLTVDPFDRITTGEILKHPWIVAAGPFAEVVQPPEFSSPPSASLHKSTKPPAVDSASEPPQIVSPIVTLPPLPPVSEIKPQEPADRAVPIKEPVPCEKQESIRSDSSVTRANKPGALSQLANHVQYLKTEKMAATMTKLFSLQGQQVGHSRLADKYLIPVHLDQIPNEKLEQAPVENLTFLVNDEMRRAISSAIFESFGSHRNKITLEEFGMIRKKFGFLPFSASTTSSGSTPSGASHNLNVNLGEILLANLMDRNHDGFITIEDIYNFQVLLMHKNEVYLQAVFRVYLEALWYPGKNLNYMNTVQHMHLKGKDIESDESPAKETTPEVASGKLAGFLDTFSGKRRGSKVKDQEGKFDVVEPPKYITAKNVAVIFEKFGYDPRHAETVFNVLCETLQRIRLGAKPVQETAKDGEEIAAVEKEDASENTSVRNVKRHRMDVNDFVRACRIDDVLIQALYRQQHQKLYALIEKAKRRFIEEKERQARLPAEERKQVTLEAAVHDVLQQAISDKIV